MRVMMVHPGAGMSVSDVHTGWARALRHLGCEVHEFNLHERLWFYENARFRDPDVPAEFVPALDLEGVQTAAAQGILAQALAYLPDVIVSTWQKQVPSRFWQILRDRGFKLVHLWTECPYEDDAQALIAPLAHLNVINDPLSLYRFEEQGAFAYYQPHSYDPDVHFVGPSQMKSDVCFVGTGFPSRVEFLESMDWETMGVDFALGGLWPEDKFTRWKIHYGVSIDNDQAADLYRGSKMSFNLYRVEANEPGLSDGWAMGPREVELAACGTFFARNPRVEGDELFPFLPTFTTPAELGEIVAHYLPLDEQRSALAERARSAVADRTFDAAAAEMLRRLDALV